MKFYEAFQNRSLTELLRTTGSEKKTAFTHSSEPGPTKKNDYGKELFEACLEFQDGYCQKSWESLPLLNLIIPKVAVDRCFSKQVFLKILYYLQENTCVGVSFQ